MGITSSSRSPFRIGIKGIIPIARTRGSRCKKKRLNSLLGIKGIRRGILRLLIEGENLNRVKPGHMLGPKYMNFQYRMLSFPNDPPSFSIVK
jgi:hypothetical protein